MPAGRRDELCQGDRRRAEEAQSRLRAALRRPPARHEVAALVTKAAKEFDELGCKVEEAAAPFPTAEAGRTFVVHWLTALQRLLQLFPESRHGEFDPNLLASAKTGPRYSLQDVVNAQVTRRELAIAWNLFFDKYDLLLSPAVAVPALRGRQEPARGAGRQGQCAVVALHLAVQPEPPSRGLGAVRAQPPGPADRPADRRGPLQGCARAARRRALCRSEPDPLPHALVSASPA